VIVVDLPVKEYAEIGRFAQLVFKYLWQGAAERRDTVANPRPVFLWADEAQHFVSPHDAMFQSTARSSRACTVYLTQNLPNLQAEMGGDDARARVDALLGNFQTKIFHANGDSVTNTWAADTIARSWQSKSSFGMNSGSAKDSSHSYNVSEALEHDVTPQEFTRLAKGGPDHRFKVEGIAFQGGRVWSTGKTHLRLFFDQRAT